MVHADFDNKMNVLLNYAYWESNDFNDENFNIGMDAEKLQVFLDNTLNFRYENFKTAYQK